MNTSFIPHGMCVEEILRYHGDALPDTVAEKLRDALQEREDHETAEAELQTKCDDMEGERDTALRDMAELRTAVSDAIGTDKYRRTLKKAELLKLLDDAEEAIKE